MLKVNSVSFSYQKKSTLENINFILQQGKNLAVLGESGCGKSTLLKLIYGIYDLQEGAISFNNKPILGPKNQLIPGDEAIKYLAQDFGLMPYSTVAENVGQFLSNMFPQKKQARIDALLEMVEMLDFKNVKPQFLSGGQQQRVALAKALAQEPKLLLLDEPFSQIDAFRKNKLRRNLFNYLKEQQISCIIATHDSSDALSFADETLIIQKGKMIALDTSENCFKAPINKYCASFFGEVSEIPKTFLFNNTTATATLLVYAFQLEVVDHSTSKVTIKNSYYRGQYFLIEATYEFGSLFFEHKSRLETGTVVFLAYNNGTNF